MPGAMQDLPWTTPRPASSGAPSRKPLLPRFHLPLASEGRGGGPLRFDTRAQDPHLWASSPRVGLLQKDRFTVGLLAPTRCASLADASAAQVVEAWDFATREAIHEKCSIFHRRNLQADGPQAASHAKAAVYLPDGFIGSAAIRASAEVGLDLWLRPLARPAAHAAGA